MRTHFLSHSSPFKPPNLTKPILLLATLTCTTHLVDSIASVSVTLHTFSNPENKLLDGNYCVPDQSACSMKFSFNFEEPISYTFITSEVTTSDIQYMTGPDAITTYNGKDIPNPFPENTTATNAIRLLTFTISAFHYDPAAGSRYDVAKFAYNNFAKLGTENYFFASGYSTFNLTTNITCAADYYKDCTVHCVETDRSTCNQTDGGKICKLGWSGTNCDIEVALSCYPNVSALNSDYTPQQDSYSDNDQVTVTCDPGYRPPPTTITCQINGTWNNPWPTCTEIRCGKVSAPNNGDVSAVSVTQTTSPIGSTVSFTCLPGHTLNGTEALSCQSDGTWNGSVPYCDVNLCPDIRDTVADKIGASGYYLANPPARHPGSVFKQACAADYVRQGLEERLCLNNGTWSGAGFTCQKTCTLDDILLPRNVTITPSSYQTDSLEVGYTLTFRCPYLSYLSTTPYMTCLDTGHWDSTVPSCMPVVDGIDKKIKSLWVSGVAILSGVLVTSVSTALVMDYLTSKLAGQHQVPIKTTPDVTDKTKLIVPSNDKSVVNCQPYTKHLKVGLNTFPNPIEDCDF